MSDFNATIGALNAVLWADWGLYIILATGILFTVWSRFAQFRHLTHGVRLLGGRYDDTGAPGAIKHYQALSAALSGTVGLGNIGGVAIAVSLGGPGAVFWLWVVGFVGMALKFTEVTLSMLYRNIDDPKNPHGGPMWVARKGLAERGPGWEKLGRVIAVLFCITLIIATIAGISFFQVWNVANITESYFGIPGIVSAAIMAVATAVVIIGGIQRLGAVAGVLTPVMIGLYLLGGLVILAINVEQLPAVFASIFRSAFAPHEAAGAFLGGTAGYAFLFGMKRALYSNEAGQGSSPIVHSAARTREPVREGIVAGLEPFIDTIIVCTFSALVILVSGVWNRPADAQLLTPPALNGSIATQSWTAPDTIAPSVEGIEWQDGQRVFTIVRGDANANTGNDMHRLYGTVEAPDEVAGAPHIRWDALESRVVPQSGDGGLWLDYVGATLTARAFDTGFDGLGKWLVTIACWLFAYSTVIAWTYYGEQGVVYLFGQRGVLPYKIAVCAIMLLAGTTLIKTTAEIDAMSTMGTGLMLWVNIPLCLLLANVAMRAYHDYIRRLDAGEFAHELRR